MVTWLMMLRDPQRCCETVRKAILAIAWLLVKNMDKTWSHAGIELVSVKPKFITLRANLALLCCVETDR